MKISSQLLTSVAILALASAPLRADDELSQRASWAVPSIDQIKQQLDELATERDLDELARLKLESLWAVDEGQLDHEQLLDNMAVTLTVLEPAAKPVVEFCRGHRTTGSANEFPILSQDDLPIFIRANLRLYFGRWLAQHELYDEAISQLEEIDVDSVVDPASLLFYRSVSYHHLLNKDKCLPALSKLLENEKEIPRRYATVARLMADDLKPLKADSLDEIARLMNDIERRQRLHRSGTKVRKKEEDVVAKLDKLIEELEKSGGGPGGPGNGPGGNQPSSPMNDSTPGGGKGPGNVDPGRIGDGMDWGNLKDMAPEDREAAMAELAKDLPAYYREVIEEYFRKLAREDDDRS